MKTVGQMLKECSLFFCDSYEDQSFQFHLRQSIAKRDAIVHYFMHGTWPEPKPIKIRAPHKFSIPNGEWKE